MALTLYFHPLASYCWKVLVALYENATPFDPVIVDLGDPASRDPFVALWPTGKMPLLRDAARGETVAETSIILDYLDLHYRGPLRLVPTDPDDAWRVRLWERVFDLYVHEPMQRIVADRIRPAGQGDAFGVAQARAQLGAGYAMVEQQLAGKTWLSGGGFGRVECAAWPALYYGDRVQPLGEAYPAITAYLARLRARPSVQRVLDEAGPYLHMFPEA